MKHIRWVGIALLVAGFVLSFTGPRYLMVAALVGGLMCVAFDLGRKYA